MIPLRSVIPSFFLFALLDILFLTFVQKKSFELQIIEVQRISSPLNYGSAIMAYLLLFFGLYWFILRNERPVLDAILLGILVNGAYELTNYATFKKWRLETVLKDTLWGGVLWGTVAYVTYQYIL